MAEHAHVIRVITLVPVEGRRDDLLAVIQPIVQQAISADGCFGAQPCEVVERPGTVAVVSRWRDQAALDSFVSRTQALLRQAVDGLVDGAPETVHYSALRP